MSSGSSLMGPRLACVINFVSRDAACSLYPFSTFCDCRSIVWGASSHTEIDAADGYQKRGWHIARSLLSNEMAHPTSRASLMDIGDGLYWSFQWHIGVCVWSSLFKLKLSGLEDNCTSERGHKYHKTRNARTRNGWHIDSIKSRGWWW